MSDTVAFQKKDAAVILFTRLAGLHSFTKISSFDFGYDCSCRITDSYNDYREKPALNSSRHRSCSLIWSADDSGSIRINGTNMLENNMKKASVTHDDIFNNLCEANLTQIKTVVMETTGDISVLHQDYLHHCKAFRNHQIIKVSSWEQYEKKEIQ